MVISLKGGQVTDEASVYRYTFSLASLEGPMGSRIVLIVGNEENNGRRTYKNFK